MVDFFTAAAASMFVPQSTEQLIHSYLLWMALFFIVNVWWDIKSPHTPPFHVHRFKDKTGLAMGATSFCSSALLIGSLLNKQTAVIVGATPVPTLIAGTVGILLSLSALCPYSVEDAGKRSGKPPSQS